MIHILWRFCKTANVLMFPLLAWILYLAVNSNNYILTHIGFVIGVITYSFLEEKFHYDMHHSKWSPFRPSHSEHHHHPTPETGVPRWWMFVFYFTLTGVFAYLQRPFFLGAWLGVFTMLLLYEFLHCMCHCDYKPKWSYLKRVRQNHLRHHYVDTNNHYPLLFPRKS